MPSINPFLRLFASPAQVLEKGRRDLARIDAAIRSENMIATADALMDAAVTVFHVKDWIAALRPELRSAAKDFAARSPWISMCREICHASKHADLMTDHFSFRENPSVVDRMTYARAEEGVHEGLRVYFVSSAAFGDHAATDVVAKAIVDWDAFLQREKI